MMFVTLFTPLPATLREVGDAVFELSGIGRDERKPGIPKVVVRLARFLENRLFSTSF